MGSTIIADSLEIHPFAQKLISDLVWQITRDELRPGQQLSSIEEMARQHDVGRSTVREALRFIESTGLVRSRHGKGTYVMEFDGSRGGNAFIDEIVDIRRMIELHATRLAVRRRTDEDIDTLGNLLTSMRRFTGDFQRFIDADRAFHGTIVVASHNPLLPSIFRNISGIYNGVQNALIYIDPNVASVSIEHHAEILDAIVRRSESDAIAATEVHLSMISRLFSEKNSISTAD